MTRKKFWCVFLTTLLAAFSGHAYTVTLAWTNSPTVTPELYQTGLMGSVDLVHWYLVLVRPYTVGDVQVTLTGRPAFECYKAFNRLNTP